MKRAGLIAILLLVLVGLGTAGYVVATNRTQ
jgi:hypothetical protein